ncbi:MAG: hypothetical protein KGL40_07580 [Rhodocyclaceae bacterium]|nr:hypothetical protein [Rhodocyclaceae bacterium]
MSRPVIYVLAGVNGCGKSSLGGRALTRIGLDWFNPDTYARDLMSVCGCSLGEANGLAWQEGFTRLERAIAQGADHAFETTLGGDSIAARLHAACATHDVLMWFCGLDSPEHHMARVKLRVAHGGHDIPEAKIRERYDTSRLNLIALLPYLSQLQVYDNSADAPAGASVADPRLLLQMERGQIAFPIDGETFKRTPDWAKPIMEAAMSMQG